ncbi:MAG: hypothetical protein B6245_01200 [Desulfobacteraceae bacterium 4572_88]|nr:MAG: hypothetical protein B6245_01200 [Desulfobacteraceae bacterium 4572_88]
MSWSICPKTIYGIPQHLRRFGNSDRILWENQQVAGLAASTQTSGFTEFPIERNRSRRFRS